eukprot:6174895-Pleurochrysis_carterae.AAC.2
MDMARRFTLIVALSNCVIRGPPLLACGLCRFLQCYLLTTGLHAQLRCATCALVVARCGARQLARPGARGRDKRAAAAILKQPPPS